MHATSCRDAWAGDPILPCFLRKASVASPSCGVVARIRSRFRQQLPSCPSQGIGERSPTRGNRRTRKSRTLPGSRCKKPRRLRHESLGPAGRKPHQPLHERRAQPVGSAPDRLRATVHRSHEPNESGKVGAGPASQRMARAPHPGARGGERGGGTRGHQRNSGARARMAIRVVRLGQYQGLFRDVLNPECGRRHCERSSQLRVARTFMG
jgi:hypothetical protein